MMRGCCVIAAIWAELSLVSRTRLP